MKILVQKIADFTNKYGIAPNTILVGPDHPLATYRMAMSLPIKVCDDLDIEVALL